MAEYQALIIGLEMAIEMEITNLRVYGDSKLIINPLLHEYEVKKEDLIPHFKQAVRLLGKFDNVTLQHVPREDNRMADALANLSTTLSLESNEKIEVPCCQRWVVPIELEEELEVNIVSVCSIETED